MSYYYTQQPRISGNSFYNPYMKGPDIGQGVPQLMQQLMQIEMYKQQQKQTQEKAIQDYMAKLQKEMREREKWQKDYELKTKQYEETKRHHEKTEQKQPSLSTFKEKYELGLKIYGNTPEGQKKSFEIAVGIKPETPRQPTDFDKKKAAIEAMPIPQEKKVEALYGIKAEDTPEEIRTKGRTARDENIRQVQNLTKRMPDDYTSDKPKKKASFLRDMVKDFPDTPPVFEGIRFDMPFKYQVATLNKEDGVATPEDTDTINKYNAMFRYFQDKALPEYGTWEAWMQSTDAKSGKFDLPQIKLWFDIYGQ
jgi:hypothetical protein